MREWTSVTSCMCPHTSMFVLIPLCTCPHASMCPHTSVCVLNYQVMNHESYGEGVDIWGAGCIGFEMMTLDFLWERKGLLAATVKVPIFLFSLLGVISLSRARAHTTALSLARAHTTALSCARKCSRTCNTCNTCARRARAYKTKKFGSRKGGLPGDASR